MIGVTTNIRDKKDMVLWCISKGYTIRQTAAEIQKTIGTVQQVMAVLKNDGLIDNEPRKKAYLTQKGKELIERMGLSQ